MFYWVNKVYGQLDKQALWHNFWVGLLSAILTYVTSYVATNILKQYVPVMYLPVVMYIWTNLTVAVEKLVDGKVQ